MNIEGQSVLITGGASGLGLATARRLSQAGAFVVIADLPSSDGAQTAASLENTTFVEADITDPEQVTTAVSLASSSAPLRAVVHTAGRGGAVRLVNRDGSPGDHTLFESTIKINLTGSFLVSSIAAAQMAKNESAGGERGVIVLTASAAAFEGQIGQAAYASSKAGVVGFTLTAARDLASKNIRVCTIAPGIMDTPMLARLRDDLRETLAATVPNPARLGQADEYAHLAQAIIENGYMNGETIRLDGAIRMAPR